MIVTGQRHGLRNRHWRRYGDGLIVRVFARRSRRRDWGMTAATESATDNADCYWGNCEPFEYVRIERGIQSHCGFHDAIMADMNACEDRSSR